MINSQVYCAMADHGISINQNGTLDPCCQYQPLPSSSPLMFYEYDQFCKTVRKSMHDDFANNLPHAGCVKCYTEEGLGWKSLRQYANEWYNSDNDSTQAIYDIELRFGNICNLKCIMCHPSASSSITSERYVNREKFSKINMAISQPWIIPHWWESTEFLDSLDFLLVDARRINITGGEPFIIPEVVDLLERLSPLSNQAIVSFNTNLTKLSDQLLAQLQKFKKLNIAVSLEGIGDMNNYLRYPSDWHTINQNINRLRTAIPHVSLTVNHTLQHASVYSLPGLSEFCCVNKIPMHMTTVQGMPNLTLDSVTEQDINEFIIWATSTKTLNDFSKSFVINAAKTAKFNPTLHFNYIEYVNTLDDIRGTDYHKIFKSRSTKPIDLS